MGRLRAGINAVTAALVVGVLIGLALTPDGRGWLRRPTLMPGSVASASASLPPASVSPAALPAAPAAPALTPLAAKSGLALRVAPDVGLPSVTGDGRRLLRVLENLVRNAIEHARTHVEVRAAAAPNGVGVEVLDDGPGLLADPQASDARRADAAGLGLQIARRILEAHGSALELADRPEGGCRSRFVLPTASS